MSIVPDKYKIIKQGWLQKKSKHLGEWRPRWFVLTTDYLFIYTQENITKTPKKTITLSTISVETFSDTILRITGDDKYLFKAATSNDKQQWIDLINIYSNECVTIPIVVECERDNDFNDNFELTVPYNDDYPYTTATLIEDVIHYLEKKYSPYKFVPTTITSASFLAQNIVYNDYDWDDSERIVNINNYTKLILHKNGLHLQIDIAIFQHKTTGFDIPCKDMKDARGLCSTYGEMRYQDKFSEELLNHLYEYSHPKVECRYGDECYAYKRLDKGGNELKDRCHIAIYRHHPRGKVLRGREKQLDDGINSFCLNDEWAENVPIYHPTVEDKKENDYNDKDVFLNLLLKEVIENGFKSDLCLNDEDEKKDNYSLLMVVNEKLKSKRHKIMGSPLNRAEMLSLLLYTGGESNYDLCKSHRNGDYVKWKWFDYNLYNAIAK
eukprot:309539_1